MEGEVDNCRPRSHRERVEEESKKSNNADRRHRHRSRSPKAMVKYKTEDVRRQRERRRLDDDIEVERRPRRSEEEKRVRERREASHGGIRGKGRRRSADGFVDVERRPWNEEERERVKASHDRRVRGRRRSSDGDIEVERRPCNEEESARERVEASYDGRRVKESRKSSDEVERRPWKEEVRVRGRERGEEASHGGRSDWPANSKNDEPQFVFGGRGAAARSSASSKKADKEDVVSAEPDFAVSGKLAAETNTYKGIVINYSEPVEARIPKKRWRLYGFKGEETLPTFFIHRQSAYLIGRDIRVCDIPVNHPSCSKQHAVLQYRIMEYEKPDGTTGKRVRPYVIDLGSTNGTYVNGARVDPARYYELLEKDTLKFGFSTREYVILHENSKVAEEDEPQIQTTT